MRHVSFFHRFLIFGVILLITLTVPILAEEGMWLPNDIPLPIIKEMQAKGLKLTAEQIFNEKGTGVANAVVSLGGGTGSFVSPEGLIITNHHVAYGAVQRISTAQNNYIEEGFLAKSRTEEQPAYGYTAYVLLSVNDMTKQVRDQLRDDMSPLDRYNAIEKISKKIVQEAEAGKDVYCYVRDMFGGIQYYLFTFKRIKDIRVVYVPPRSIGEFGGDIDNWMWPRHTGDFSFLRAYVDPEGNTAEYSEKNVPYNPKSYLKICQEGVKEGDFALIAGFPGSTQRYMTSYGIDAQENFYLPRRIDQYKRWIEILEKASAEDPDAAVKVAGLIKGLNNSMKYRQGLVDGFRKFNLLEAKRKMEKEFTEFLNENEQARRQFKDVLPRIKEIYEEEKSYRLKEEALDLLGRASFLDFASTMYKWSIEKQKENMERDPAFMERNIPQIKRRLEVAQRTLHPASDREAMKMFLHLAGDLPESQRIKGLEEWLGGKSGSQLDEAIENLLNTLYSNTKLGDGATRLKMFDMNHQELINQGDPFIGLAEKLYPEQEELEEKSKAVRGALSEIEPLWIQGLAAWKMGTLYDDANGTMRINYGVVRGYSPHDAVWYAPYTTLSGVIEKHTGKEPFNVPDRLQELYNAKDYGRYKDEKLSDIPVNLLTTNDATGGNSGSPLLNGKGALVGVLFDGNYEAMSSDYQFNEAITRSIHVDIRYVLFIADKFNNAQNVLMEMGVK